MTLPAEPPAEEDRARSWRPPALPRSARRRELAYVVVDEILGQRVSLVVCDWPRVDRAGRLRFPGRPSSLAADRRALQEHLDTHRRPRAHRGRPLRIGDVFAVRVRASALDGAAGDPLGQHVEPILAPDAWMQPPIHDVTADARDEAKLAFSAAVTPALDPAQARALRRARVTDEPPSRLGSGTRWARDRVRWLGATAAVAVAGLAVGYAVAPDDGAAPPPAEVVGVESGPGITDSSFAAFTFSGAAGYECRLDGAGAFEPCPSAHTGLAEGEHALEVRAAGSQIVSRYRWARVVPPEVEVDAPRVTRPGAGVTIAFAATGPGAERFQCRLDGERFTRCDSERSQSYPASALPLGPHAFEVRALERGVAGRPAIHTWLVQAPARAAAPFVTIESGPGVSTGPTARFGLSGAARYACRLDRRGAFEPCPAEVELGELEAGDHLLEVRGLDARGGRGAVATYPWRVVLPPLAAITATPDPPVDDTDRLVFEFQADDEGASFECRFDAEAYRACTSGQVFAPLDAGPHAFEVRATTEGVAGVPAIHVFRVEPSSSQSGS